MNFSIEEIALSPFTKNLAETALVSIEGTSGSAIYNSTNKKRRKLAPSLVVVVVVEV